MAELFDSNATLVATFTERRHDTDVDPRATIQSRLVLAPGSTSADAQLTLADLPRLAVAFPGAREAPPADVDLEVTGVLGEGGMGRVLLARQRSLKREVAIKRVKDESGHPEDRERLLSEALITGALEHPCIVPIHALGQDAEGEPLLVMRRLEGVVWSELAEDPEHPMWASLAPAGEDRLEVHLEILMTLCNAVHFANCRGILHRDLKPDNVMIGAFGEVYLVDWGVALDLAWLRRATANGQAPPPASVVGTPALMAPEMVMGDPTCVDERTDVYLLGATLHAVLTGRPRHAGQSISQVLGAALLSAPCLYGAELPAELGLICNRATSADPDARYTSALELRTALAAFRRHRGSVALSAEASTRLGELQRPGSADLLDEARRHALMTECRFGFMQALRAWNGNSAAREGLDRCLEVMIEHELGQRDAAGARLLHAERSAPHPALLARIEALEGEIQGAALLEARLRAMERDQDPTLGARPQMLFLGAMALFSGGLTAYFVSRGGEASAAELIVPPLVMLALILLGSWVLWRHLPEGLARRLMRAFILVPVIVLVHRLEALALGQSVASIFAADLWLLAAMSLILGLTVNLVAASAALPFCVGALLVARSPAQANNIFGVSLLAGVTVIVATRSRWRKLS